MLAWASELRRQGLLGINQRNVEFTLRYNDRTLYPRVDDKVLTKQLAHDSGIPVPETYGVVQSIGQLRQVGSFLDDYSDFVIKPARGSGGEGITVIVGRANQQFRQSSGNILGEKDLCFHISNILNGMYSLGGRTDTALIEYRVKPSQVFSDISYQGVPDIRIIVFLGVPVMAMLRLPTQLSGGKANLHQGAIGVGVNIAKGQTLSNAVWRNDLVTEHPDTGNAITHISIPHWPELLELASQCYDITGLGYQGVDIVLDEQKGPMLLEINARPGLNIQLANRAGLLPRLRQVEASAKELDTAERRIAFATQEFHPEI